MAVKKSKLREIDGSKYSFEFEANKLIGIKKEGENGNLSQINPNTIVFDDVSGSTEALNEYNINKHGSNDGAYEDSIEKADRGQLSTYYNVQAKKEDNKLFVSPAQNSQERRLAYSTPSGDDVSGYERDSRKKFRFFGPEIKSKILAYPLDINPNQDHMKIVRYRYARADINQSKPPRSEKFFPPLVAPKVNVAGDSVKGSKQLATIILPMPKATDVNGVEWGKSELTASGVAALGLARGLSLGGRLTGKSDLQRLIDKKARESAGPRGMGPDILGGVAAFTQAQAANQVTQAANAAFGTDLDADTFLARTGGQVLNPNAEMLFQGPVIRDFSFSFLMIARSEKEGMEIRKIIREFKLGMAPKFRNRVFLETPDVFTLEYKNGKTDKDVLKTANRFNPGGLALTTMNVDYAPNGYWSAYRDSQPVALKIDLNFTELRPIYEGDQAITPEDSVGY